ncbi:MAG: VCBS repeat-containing protein, partial [Elusimicrobia bacterium]|nr:VCBS repeat-containing protein [Elusimicrobiota bacterium]
MLKLTNRMIIGLALGACLCLVLAPSFVYAAEDKPIIKVVTDKELYASDETINIFIEAKNPTSKEIQLNLGTSLRSDYMIDDTFCWSHNKLGLSNSPQVTLAANSSTTVCQFSYSPQEAGKLASGTHTISGVIIGYGSDSKTIKIEPSTQVIQLASLSRNDKVAGDGNQNFSPGATPTHVYSAGVKSKQVNKEGTSLTEGTKEEGAFAETEHQENESIEITTKEEKISPDAPLQQSTAAPESTPLNNNPSTPDNTLPPGDLGGVPPVIIGGGRIETGDTTPPAAPTLISPQLRTRSARQILSGTKDAQSSVLLNGEQIVTLDALTTWNYTISLQLGNNILNFTSKDAAGNESQPYSVEIVLETEPPAVNPPATPQVNSLISPTKINTQTISGSKETNTAILLNSVEIVALNAATTWSYTVSLQEGNNILSFTAKDTPGNLSEPYLANIILDTHTSVSIDAPFSPTNLATQTITGTREENATLNVTASATVSGISYPSSTTWQVDLTNLNLGNNSFNATATDLAGNTATASSIIRRVTVFSNVTSQSGINLNAARLSGSDDKNYHWTTLSFDYDNDGDLDLYLIIYGGYNILYRNNGDGTFTDVTTQAGLQDTTEWKDTGLAFDYNNDGYQDILVLRRAAPLVLYRNKGDGTFENVSASSGLGESRQSGAAVADFDLDGKPDIIIVHPYGYFNSVFYHNNGNGTFTNISSQVGLGEQYSIHWNAAAIDYDKDGDPDLYITGGAGPPSTKAMLFRNNFKETGILSFTDVTAASGLGGMTATDTDVLVGDYNNDGLMDIYVPVCSTGQGPSLLFKNNGNGTFTEVAAAAGVAYNQPINSAQFIDYDNDGYLDLYLCLNTATGILYHNNGNGTFTDATTSVGINNGGYGVMKVDISDYNNDGFCDLIRNGYSAEIVPVLYKNNKNNYHWIIIRLQSSISNKDALGT